MSQQSTSTAKAAESQIIQVENNRSEGKKMKKRKVFGSLRSKFDRSFQTGQNPNFSIWVRV
jgi:chromosome condensin MukBEF MukE localization factor